MLYNVVNTNSSGAALNTLVDINITPEDIFGCSDSNFDNETDCLENEGEWKNGIDTIELTAEIYSEQDGIPSLQFTTSEEAIVVKTIKGRSTLDRKAVAQAGIDLSAFEKTAAPTERLEIKQV